MKQRTGNSIAPIYLAPIYLASILLASIHFMWPLPLPAADAPPPLPVPIAATASYVDAIEAHMGYVTEHALDEYGPVPTPMWLATIDIKTSRLPMHREPQHRNDSHLNCSNLYLDQPTVVAAYELARRTGCKCYSDAANAYLRAWLKTNQQNVATSSLLSASNNYDVIRDEVVSRPLHLTRRPTHTPAWETIWNESPEVTAQAIQTLAIASIGSQQILASPDVRPASDLVTHAIAVDSLCWLASKTNDPQGELQRLAQKIVHRVSISESAIGETGVWVESLIRASRNTGEPNFREIAAKTLTDWLERHKGGTTGQRQSESSTSVDLASSLGSVDGAAFDDISAFEWRREDSFQNPLPIAEATLSLWEATQQDRYRRAAMRWGETIRASLLAKAEDGASAEDYGRAIHFLTRASDSLRQPEWRDLAREVADDAITHLYEPKLGMFRSRVGEERCDAIDGPGFLILALLYLDGPDPTEQSALHF